MTLPVSRLVNVAVSLGTLPAQGRNFGDLLVIGDSNVISGLERIRQFGNLTDVGGDFSITSPEYLAAQLYFGQSPQPTNLSIGRWLRTATAGEVQGAVLTAAQQVLSNFLVITSGGFSVTIDGTVHALTALNFDSVTNLNGVASAVTTGLSGAGTCVWTGSQFEITSATTGAGIQASGTFTFSGQPAPNDTVTINGITVTFVASGPSGNQVLIGINSTATATNLWAFLSASANASLLVNSYSISGLVVTVTYKTVGTAGNSIAISKSATNIAVSGADLAGG